MDNQFMTGVTVNALYFDNEEVISVSGGMADKIICIMENGQMAPVAWFEVWKDGVMTSKWNGAALQGVGFHAPNTMEE